MFVPALRAAEWIPKAVAAGADAVIVDLEDAVAPAAKDEARELLRGLRFETVRPYAVVVRVNSGDRAVADADAAAAANVDAVMLPKVESAEELRALHAPRGTPIVALIETARGVARATETAASSDSLAAIAFGSFDFAADVGAAPSREGTELLHARSQLVLAAAIARVPALDSPWLDIRDLDGLRTEALAGRRLGFSGKLAIHPRQVDVINASFSPSEAEVDDAHGILAALEDARRTGSGIAVYNGKMVDRPLALSAERVIARAARLTEKRPAGL